MECPFCKKEIPDKSVFCGHCGRRIEEAPEPTLLGGPVEAAMSETLVDQAVMPVSAPADAGPTAPQPAAGPTIQVDPSLEGVQVQSSPGGPSLQQQSEEKAERRAATDVEARARAEEARLEAKRARAETLRGEEAREQEAQGEAPTEKNPATGEGGFRETMWFMDALDEDALSKIETDDIRDRSEKFTDDGREIDDEVRREFSLNAGGKKKLGATSFRQARLDLERVEEEARSGSGGAIVGLVLLGLGVLLAGAWFLFFKDMI